MFLEVDSQVKAKDGVWPSEEKSYSDTPCVGKEGNHMVW